MKRFGLVALLPGMLGAALLLASTGLHTASDTGPSVQMTVTPIR